MKAKPVKEQDLALLRREFSATKTAFLVGFSGLKSGHVDDLRRKIQAANGSYRVVRNTLARKASEGTSLAPVAADFRGPTAVVIAREEAGGLAKVLSDFAKSNPAVTLKSGIFDGAVLGAAECREIGNLPSREVLLSRLAGLLQSPMVRLVTVLSAPSRNLAVVLDQVASKKNEGGA